MKKKYPTVTGNLTKQERVALESTLSEQEWFNAVQAMKETRAGDGYPDDWWPVVWTGGIRAEAERRWAHSA